LQLPNAPVIALNNQLPLGLHTFMLQVRSADGRTSFNQIQINVTVGAKPIGIYSVSLSTTRAANPFLLNIGKPFALSARDTTENQPILVDWIANNDVDVSDITICPLGAFGSSLFFSGQKLFGILNFKVQATTVSARAQIDILVNLPPQGGFCSVLPNMGSEETVFVSYCSGVTDDHLPLSFGLRYRNVLTEKEVDLPAATVASRNFLLPSGTFLVHIVSCDALQSCADIYTTAVVVDPSSAATERQLHFMRDALSRGQFLQLIDTVKLISQSFVSSPTIRRLQQQQLNIRTETLFAILNTTVSIQLNDGLALEFVKALQAIPTEAVAFSDNDSTLALLALKKLCLSSTGYVTFSVTLPYLQSIFDYSNPSLIPEILSTASVCRQRSASDILIGQTRPLFFSSSASWTVTAIPKYGLDLYNSVFSFRSNAFELPKIFITKGISSAVEPANMVSDCYVIIILISILT
jgi:hypothetical protein